MFDVVQTDGVSCRFCGAAFAPPHENEWGLCANCYFRVPAYFEPRNANSPPTDEEVELFALKALERAARAVMKNKPYVRCQCIQTVGNNTFHRGYQCGSLAKHNRDGRLVCDAHKRAAKPKYVDQPKSETDTIEGIIRVLVIAKPGLKEVCKRIGGEA